MRLVHWVVGNAAFCASHLFPMVWGVPPSSPGNGTFLVLWSNIGPKFYHQAGEGEAPGGGWQTVGPLSSVIPVPSKTSTIADISDWQTLDLAESEVLWAEDAVLIRKDLQDVRLSAHSDKTIVLFLPTGRVAVFQPFRAMDPITGEPPFTKWGIWLEEQNKMSTTWETWCFKMWASPPSLVVTRMRVPNVLRFEGLVQELLRVAANVGVAQVEFWNLSANFCNAFAAAGGQTFEQHDHLPSVKYYGNVDKQHVQLAFNEKYVSSFCMIRQQY